MASPEQIYLSDFIKKVHEDLRIRTAESDSLEAWKNHCNDEETLSKYARAMKTLATKYWDKNLAENQSRISWTYRASLDYYRNHLTSIRDKEMSIASKLSLNIGKVNDIQNGKFKLLDVGSCYNPFGQYTCMEVTAVDIAPANTDVLKCDFLNVDIGENTSIKDNRILKLSKNYFDIIVFSLLLEYLPHTYQRYECCLKAYELLKTEGILVVISPDSNHVGSNAKLIKSWRFVLAKMGFSRVKYEKLPHVHCMVFRKSFCKEIPTRWTELNKHMDVYDRILIPQDFKSGATNVPVCNDTERNSDASEYSDVWKEFPFQDIDV